MRDAPASYSTARSSLPSRGGQVALIARALGTPLMPWQRQVADVALEVLPNGAWRYPLVVVTVPRQAGKTTLVSAVAMQRAMTRPGSRVFMTAQKGKDARARWRDLRDRVEADGSPLAAHVTTLSGAGTETLRLPNRSEVKPFAPTRDALHGETPPLVIIDEAWAFDAARGEDLMQAIRPAQITLRDRQLWVISTAGTSESAFLRELVDTGRESIGDPGAALAYFEWSAPEGADPYAAETWAFHPAIGHTIEVEDIAGEARTMSRGGFERAYLNRWTASADTIVDLDKLRARFAEVDPPGRGVVSLAYDVAPDRSESAIWVAWPVPGGVHVHPWLVAPGSAWLAQAVKDARDKLAPRSIMADDGGPARQTTDDLARAGVTVDVLGYRDLATACSGLVSAIEDDTVTFGDSPALVDGFAAAVWKSVSDQRAFDRRKSTGPVSSPIAAAVARWAALHAAELAPRPAIYGA